MTSDYSQGEQYPKPAQYTGILDPYHQSLQDQGYPLPEAPYDTSQYPVLEEGPNEQGDYADSGDYEDLEDYDETENHEVPESSSFGEDSDKENNPPDDFSDPDIDSYHGTQPQSQSPQERESGEGSSSEESEDGPHNNNGLLGHTADDIVFGDREHKTRRYNQNPGMTKYTFEERWDTMEIADGLLDRHADKVQNLKKWLDNIGSEKELQLRRKLYECSVSLLQVLDNPVHKRGKEEPAQAVSKLRAKKIGERDIHTLAVKIMEEAVHAQGPVHEEERKKLDEAFEEFNGTWSRIDSICNLLKHNKATVKQLLDRSFLEKLTDAPAHTFRQKLSNSRSNEKKGMEIKAGQKSIKEAKKTEVYLLSCSMIFFTNRVKDYRFRPRGGAGGRRRVGHYQKKDS